MTKLTDELFERYAEVQTKIDGLEELKTAIREKLAKTLPEDGVKNKYGSFSFMSKKTWTYPAKISEMEGLLKKEKEVAQMSGQATFTEKKTLVISLNKDE